MILSGIIPLAPKAKGRVRLTKSGKAYNPPTTRRAQKSFAFILKQLSIKSDHDFPIPRKEPLEVSVTFFHKGGTDGKPKITVPDIDNQVKLFLDAITDAYIWHSDSQVTKLIIEDLWSGDNPSRVKFSIKKHEV